MLIIKITQKGPPYFTGPPEKIIGTTGRHAPNEVARHGTHHEPISNNRITNKVNFDAT